MPAYDAEAIKAQYPQMAHLIGHPEIGPILNKAYTEEWPADRFQAAIMATTWWRTTASSIRKWDEKRANDPATADREVGSKGVMVRQLAMNMGVPLNEGEIGWWAEKALREGMSDNELKFYLSQFVRYSSATSIAGIGFQSVAQKVRTMAAEYLMPTNPQVEENWVRGLMNGTITEDGIKAYYQEQAKLRHPSMASVLDQGITVKQYMAPIVAQVAQTLERSPETVDLMNPAFGALIDHYDEKAGMARPMTLTEAAMWARQRPGWGETTQAHNQTDEMASALIKTFGQGL